MKHIDEYRDREMVQSLCRQLDKTVKQPVRIMEVCGTHTMSIFRHGIREMLPAPVRLISGPGCPVCVTPAGTIDAFIRLAYRDKTIVATFGDMIRVPGSGQSLADARAAGCRVEMVYSPMDALVLAQKNPDAMVVFFSIGFETTTPTIAATVLEAARLELNNFCIFPANRIMPPPLAALMEDPALEVDGLLCPGHVSVITGSEAFRFLVDDYGLACAIGGFEPADILLAILALVGQVQTGQPDVENCYGRAVTPAGNQRAREIAEQVFIPVDSRWRGLGMIPVSGLAVRPEFARFDATVRLDIEGHEIEEPKGCLCGSILKGIHEPPDCPLFGTRCTPATPIGPCMVSAEGTCAAWQRYGGILHP